MTTKFLIATMVTVLVAGPVLAQGKGGGKGGGGGGEGRGASGLDHPSMGPGRDAPDAAREDKKMRPSDSADTDRSAPASGVKGKSERTASGAAQRLAASMRDINQTAFAQRRDLHESVDMGLESSRQALKQIQADAKASRADARAEFKSALNEVKARERELKETLKASRKADEANWEARRSALARAHKNHADAVARLEAIAGDAKP